MMTHQRRSTIPVQGVMCGSGLILLSLSCQAESSFLRGAAEPGSGSNPEPTAKDAQLELGPRTVTVAPGSNVILELAIDHLNRIVTPFQQPSVRTVSSLSTEVDGNVIYLATAEETPAILYITDADNDRTTIALTLAPRRVPPREIRLLVPGVERVEPRRLTSSNSAPSIPELPPVATWRQDQPYLVELTSGFRALALGEIPSGYRERAARGSETLTCGPGVSLSHRRAFDGSPLRFLTAKVRGRGNTVSDLDETQCHLRSGQPIAALALWQNPTSSPANEAELIVAIDQTRARTRAPNQVGGRP